MRLFYKANNRSWCVLQMSSRTRVTVEFSAHLMYRHALWFRTSTFRLAFRPPAMRQGHFILLKYMLQCIFSYAPTSKFYTPVPMSCYVISWGWSHAHITHNLRHVSCHISKRHVWVMYVARFIFERMLVFKFVRVFLYAIIA